MRQAYATCAAWAAFQRQPWLVSGLVLCLLLDGPASLSTKFLDPLAAARAEAAKYCGVCYCKRTRKYLVHIRVNGQQKHIGRFNCALQAAEAYDSKLRSLFSDDKLRLRRYLNFPSNEEASYCETVEQSRQRGLRISGQNLRSEARAAMLLDAAVSSSSDAAGFELCRLSGASHADAVFRPKGSEEGGGLLLQLKAATSSGQRGRRYNFNHMVGYDGMLVIMMALDTNHVWAAAGSQLFSESL